MAGEMKWHPYPQETPTVDASMESDYLLILSPQAIPPLVGYFDGAEGRFYLMGCRAGDLELRDVKAWTPLPKIPASLYEDRPLLLQYARSSNLIEEE